MDDKRTPMEAEVLEMPRPSQPVCPDSFYGTAAKPRPRRSHAGLWICVGLAVIALCTFYVVDTLLRVRVEKRDGGFRLDMQEPAATEAQDDPVRDLLVTVGGSADYDLPQQSGAVRLPVADGAGDSLSPEEIYAKLSPAVVCVTVEGYYDSSVCTGVVISPDGYILSASGDLSSASALTVSFSDGRSMSVQCVGEDRVTGLCLLKAEAENLSTAVFASDAAPAVGSEVYCVCNPYGSQMPNLFRSGMLALSRSVELGGQSYGLLQSSAQQGAGSGCPLLDSRGRILGLTAPIGKRLVSGEDPCFAVCTADLERIVAQLDSSAGEGCWLGLEVSDIPEEYQFLYGFPGSVWIDSVARGSAPDGVLLQYDVITSVDGETVNSAADFENILARHKVGDRVRLLLYRSGKWYTVLLPVTAR